MFNWILKVRQKTDKEKKMVAFLISLFFSGIIFVIWVTILFPNFLNEKKIENKKFDTPKDNITANVSASLGQVKGSFLELKSMLQNLKLSSDIEYDSVLDSK